MPYIEHKERQKYDIQVAETPGQLNYQFTMLIVEYMKKNGLSYQKINDVIGALSACQAEFYRRVVIPYEDEKIKTNGDCY